MHTFRIFEEPDSIRFRRATNLKAIALLLGVELCSFFVYQAIPLRFRIGFLVMLTVVFLGVLWPRIISEEVIVSRGSFIYRRGFWPLVIRTKLDWKDLDQPRVVNAGVRGRRGPIGFNDVRTGKTYRIGAGLPPADCRKLLAAVERFRETIF